MTLDLIQQNIDEIHDKTEGWTTLERVQNAPYTCKLDGQVSGLLMAKQIIEKIFEYEHVRESRKSVTTQE